MIVGFLMRVVFAQIVEERRRKPIVFYSRIQAISSQSI
jgi:hypothetical protein